MLQLISISKKYDNFIALENINLNLSAGQIVGLVGPNGAGKTTLLRIIAAILRADSGRLLFKGTNIQYAASAYLEKVGYMPEDGGLYLRLTPLQNLMFYRSFYKQSMSREILDAYLQEFKLQREICIQCGKLSKGTRQKILLLKSMLNNPELLLLDEPLDHLDPEMRIKIKQKLREAGAEGKLVLLSSHTLAELEDLCTTIIFINGGKILACAGLAQLSQRYANAAGQSLESLYLRIIGSS